MTKKVVVQKWKESEKGWGVRPDGYSLHLTDQDREAYEKAYWDSMPDEIQDEHSRTCGTPYMAEVDDETFTKVKESANGIRFYNNKYPGDQGPDGWKARK